MPQPDPWADLADDIRRGRASDIEQAEVWQARAEKAEARVAELEAALRDAREWLANSKVREALRVIDKALARPAGEPDHA